VILGGLVAAYTAGRLKPEVLKGPTTSTARRRPWRSWAG
jgi:hypothetical protein